MGMISISHLQVFNPYTGKGFTPWLTLDEGIRVTYVTAIEGLFDLSMKVGASKVMLDMDSAAIERRDSGLDNWFSAYLSVSDRAYGDYSCSITWTSYSERGPGGVHRVCVDDFEQNVVGDIQDVTHCDLFTHACSVLDALREPVMARVTGSEVLEEPKQAIEAVCTEWDVLD